jgi:uncharacterized membrane protein (DUF4010 family)
MVADIMLLAKILMALLLGAFIGTEREYHKKGIGLGLRTTTFVSLIGMLSTYFSAVLGTPIIMFFSLLAVCAFAMSIFWYRVKEKEHHIGLTTSVTIILTFFIGAMVTMDLYIESIVLSIAVFVLLFSKKFFIYEIKHLTRDEILSAIQFGILAFVIYPFIPDQEFFMINFKVVWEVVILVSAISFVGFLAMRKFGEKKGAIITSIFGGIVNSSGVVVSMIHRYKSNRKALNLFVFAALISLMMMLFRNFLIGLIVTNNYQLVLPHVMKYIVIVLFYFSFIFYFFVKKISKIKSHKVVSESPFAIKPALYFGILFTVILFISKVALGYFGNDVILIISLIGGLVSSSGVAASSAVLFSGGSISIELFLDSIVIGSIGAMAGDALTAYVFKEPKFGIKILKYVAALMIILALSTLI